MQVSKLKGICILCSMLLFMHGSSQIVITGETAFHKASYGAEFGTLEVTNAPDNGGLITCFVQNQGTGADSVINIKASRNGVYDTSFYCNWWPLQMGAAGSNDAITSVQVKGLNAPFGEGDTVLIEVFTSGGHTASQTFINRTPVLRIGNILPSQDMRALYVYLRNDGSSPVSVAGVTLNQSVYTPQVSPQLSTAGNSSNYTVAAGNVLILKLNFATALAELSPLALRVAYTDSLSNARWVSTFQRLVKAHYFTGTWNSSLFNNDKEEGRKLVRQLGITSVFGPGNFGLMQNALDEYYMQTVHEANFDSAGTFGASAGAAYVAARANEDALHYWSVDDEPDLNGKDVKQELAKNMAYWKNDTNTPSYVNLAAQKKYQRYGFFTDVVSMDHYSDDGPPNVIPFPWWYTSEGSVREAIEYTAQLKLNTEPKRLTSWCQLAANTWGVDHQAEDFIINFQFWSHVSHGAKGIHYFLATPETKSDYPLQWEEALYSTRQLSAVKNLCMYGECWQGVKVNSGNVIANGLVSENTLMITVLNNSIDYTVNNVFNHDWIPTIQPVDFQLEVTVPDWIPLQQFYEVLSTGKISIGSLVNTSGRTYQISGTINTKSQVFVIGSNDNVAPEQVTKINVPDKISPNRFTLSWSEPFDNFGVRGYYIKADNDIIDTVFAPIWESADKANACQVGYWSVIPFDDAGNTGQPCVLTIDWSGVGSGTPVLYQQPQNVTVNAGSNAVFSIADSAATGVAYTWQVDTGNGVWANLANNANYSGVFTNTLTVYGTQHNNGCKFRCAVTVGCGQPVLTSDAALLTVNGSVGISEIAKNNLRVFPNPAAESITISVAQVYPQTTVVIRDVNGRLCLNAAIKNEQTVLDVSTLSGGVYFVGLYQNRLFCNVVKLIKL